MNINAKLIKDSRTQRHWTQQHLADACGLSLRTIQRVERYGSASNETVAALASVFEIDQKEIVSVKPVEVQIVDGRAEKSETQYQSKKWAERITLVLTSMTIGFVMALVVIN